MKTQTLSVALYVRISTAEGKQRTDNQLRELRKYARGMRWKIQAEYVDTISGATIHRPALDQMMTAAARHEFDSVIVFDLSRLTRRGPASAFEIIERLRNSNVDLWSMTQEYFRTSGPAGPLLIAIAAFLAQQERENLTARIKAGLSRAKAEGVTLGRRRTVVDREKLRGMIDAGKGVRQIGAALKIPKSTAGRLAAEMKKEKATK